MMCKKLWGRLLDAPISVPYHPSVTSSPRWFHFFEWGHIFWFYFVPMSFPHCFCLHKRAVAWGFFARAKEVVLDRIIPGHFFHELCFTFAVGTNDRHIACAHVALLGVLIEINFNCKSTDFLGFCQILGVFYIPILEEYTIPIMQSKNSVVTWVVILAVILVAVGAYLFSHSDSGSEMMGNKQDVSGMVEVSGATAQMAEGQNFLSYKFYVPEGMTSSKGDDSQTVVVKGADDSQKALAYFSYEGIRAWTPEQYFDSIIAPKVPVLTSTSTVHMGSYDWYHVESNTMEWNIATLKGGEWLMMVESKKADADAVKNIFNTLKVD